MKLSQKAVDLEKVYFSQMHFEEIPIYLQDKDMPAYKLVDGAGKSDRIVSLKVLWSNLAMIYRMINSVSRFLPNGPSFPSFARKLPAFGYKTFYLIPQEQPAAGSVQNTRRMAAWKWKMNMFTLLFHEDGSYDLTNKATGRDLPSSRNLRGHRGCRQRIYVQGSKRT